MAVRNIPLGILPFGIWTLGFMAVRNIPLGMLPFAMWTLALVPLGLLLGHFRFEVFKIVHSILESHGEASWQIYTMSVCLSISVYLFQTYITN